MKAMSMFRGWSVVFRKELLDGLRDRRSILSVLSLPLLGPLMIYVTFTAVANTATPSEVVEVPVVGAAYAEHLVDFMKQHGLSIVEPPEDPEKAVRDRDVPFVVIIPENFEEEFAQLHPPEVRFVVDESNRDAMAETRKLQAVLQGYSSQIGMLRLIARGVSPEISNAVTIERVDVSSDQEKAALMLNMVPMFIILAAFICGMQIAVDATAGERERGSLEPLLITPVRRRSIVLGKWLAAVLFSGIGVLLTLVNSVVVLSFVPLHELGIRFSLSATQVIGMGAAILPLAFLATGLQLVVATFSRSFKEAQTSLSLLMFLPMVPSMWSILVPFENQRWMDFVPMLAQQTILSNVLSGKSLPFSSFLIAGFMSLLVGIGCVLVTARLFRRERIIYG